VVGSVATIRYGQNLAWIGMVLVDPVHRQQGIGRRLLEEAGQILKDENCVKLDATPAGRHVYTKLGFKEEYELSRLSARSFNAQHLTSYPTTTVLAANELESVRLYDREIFGGALHAFPGGGVEGAIVFTTDVEDYTDLDL